MVRVEKIDNIIVDDKITKVVMTVNDGTNVIDNEVYLAFSDENTKKRYIVYTSEQAKSETDRIPFTLATISLGENGYVIEETSKEDHQNLELPVLNIIGLNADKGLDEVKKILTDKFPSIVISDLQVLKTNVTNITISETKPPKKANMPIAIANGIKKFYLYQLNKELKKIYNATEMTDIEKQASIEKLDNIESRLDSVNEVYLANAEKRGGLTPSMEKSLSEIDTAKKDIEAAKNRLQTLQSDYTEELQEDLTNSVNEENNIEENVSEPLVEEPQIDTTEQNSEELNQLSQTNESELNETSVDTIDSTEEVQEQLPEEISNESSVQNIEESLSDTQDKSNDNLVENTDSLSGIQPVEETISQEEPVKEISVSQLIENVLIEYRKEIYEKIQLEMSSTLNKFSESVDSFVEKIKNDISLIYEQKLEEQESKHQNELLSLSKGFSELKEKSEQEIQQARETKEKNNNLQQENKTLIEKNNELQSTVDSQKTLLDQQDSNINDLRGEINQLRETNEGLQKYKTAYEQVVQMVGNLTPVDPNQQLIDEAVDYAIEKVTPTK